MRVNMLLVSAVFLAAPAWAEVKELNGEEMLDTYVQGISISQTVTDKTFDTDGDELREVTAQERDQLGMVPPQVSVQNTEALNRTPTFDELLASTPEGSDARAVLEGSIVQSGTMTHLDLSIERAALEANLQDTSRPDIRAMESTLLELLPSATGYQFEFANRGF